MQNAVKEAKIKPEEAEVEELNFDTFYTQLKAMSKMGPLKNVFGMMGAPDVLKGHAGAGRRQAEEIQVIIASMTKS